MSQVLRKKITIASNCSLSLYGGTFGPIRSPFYETIPNIARLICDGIEVYEETPEGRVRLTMSNFDSTKGEEARIAKEQQAAARVRVQEEQKAIEAEQARVRAQEEAKNKARNEQRAREEQQRNNQKNNKNNQKNYNNQKPVTADVIVEE